MYIICMNDSYVSGISCQIWYIFTCSSYVSFYNHTKNPTKLEKRPKTKKEKDMSYGEIKNIMDLWNILCNNFIEKRDIKIKCGFSWNDKVKRDIKIKCGFSWNDKVKTIKNLMSCLQILLCVNIF